MIDKYCYKAYKILFKNINIYSIYFYCIIFFIFTFFVSFFHFITDIQTMIIKRKYYNKLLNTT